MSKRLLIFTASALLLVACNVTATGGLLGAIGTALIVALGVFVSVGTQTGCDNRGRACLSPPMDPCLSVTPCLKPPYHPPVKSKDMGNAPDGSDPSDIGGGVGFVPSQRDEILARLGDRLPADVAGRLGAGQRSGVRGDDEGEA